MFNSDFEMITSVEEAKELLVKFEKFWDVIFGKKDKEIISKEELKA